MKKTALLSLLLVTTVSFSNVSSAFGLAGALEQPTYKEKKDFNKINEVKKAKKTRAVKSLEKSFTTWVNAYNKKDIESFMSLYAPDTIYANANSGFIKGIDNVKAWHNKAFAETKGKLKYVQESLTVKGNLGVVLINYTIEPNGAQKTEEDYDGRAMLVFRKATFGKWFLLYDMDQTVSGVLPVNKPVPLLTSSKNKTFPDTNHKVIKRLESTNVNNLTPKQALDLLYELKEGL